MHKDDPKNYITLRSIGEHYMQSEHQDAKYILKMIEVTQNFLTNTSTEFQKSRQEWIKNPVLQKILDDAGKLELIFEKTSKDEETCSAFNYCKDSMKARLKFMKENKDKIYGYYVKNENLLKRVIEKSDDNLNQLDV